MMQHGGARGEAAAAPDVSPAPPSGAAGGAPAPPRLCGWKCLPRALREDKRANK